MVPFSIWIPPLEIVADSQPVETLAIPYQSRAGGALFAVPAEFLDENYLVEANSNEGEVLGPSNVFYSDLIEEAEDGTVIQVGRKASVMIVDLSDDALEGMREYDPVTDSTAHFCPFDEEKSSAVPKATPKKQAKKVSNAVLADQVAHLVAQMQLLASQQQEMRESFLPASSAIPADVGLSGKSQPAVPGVAPAAKVGVPNSTLVQIGPPPKTRQPVASPGVPDVVVENEPEDPFAAGSNEPAALTVATALTQQSTAITALVAHLASGDPLAELASGGGVSKGGLLGGRECKVS